MGQRAFPTLIRHWIEKSGPIFKGLGTQYRCSATAAINLCGDSPLLAGLTWLRLRQRRKLWVSVTDGGPALIQNWASAHSLRITGAVLGNRLRRWPNIDLRVCCKFCRWLNIGQMSATFAHHPANTWNSPNGVSMLAHRLQRWPNIEITLGECPVFAGMLTQTGSYCGSSTLLRKLTFSLRRSHMEKSKDKVWWNI